MLSPCSRQAASLDFVAIDFETANEKRNSACAIGLTEVRDGLVQDPVYHLIRPAEMRFSHWNTRIHGITAADVMHAHTLTDLWPSIRHLFEGRLLIAHNAAFDLSVLRNSFQSASVEVPHLSYLCSLKLSRRAWPELGSYSLGALAHYHRLSLKHHHAGSDSKACAEIVLIAVKSQGLACPRQLAECLGVSVGETVSKERSSSKKRSA